MKTPSHYLDKSVVRFVETEETHLLQIMWYETTYLLLLRDFFGHFSKLAIIRIDFTTTLSAFCMLPYACLHNTMMLHCQKCMNYFAHICSEMKIPVWKILRMIYVDD